MNQPYDYTPQNDHPPFYNQNFNAPYQPKNGNGFATASLTLGILSFVLCCCCALIVSPILAILAIIFAVIAKKKNHGVMSGKAKAGLILGIVFLVLFALLLVIVVTNEELMAILSDPAAFEEYYEKYYEEYYGEHYDEYGEPLFHAP